MEKLDKGKKGEDQALDFLLTQGYRLITRNYTSLNAEIDLIVQKEDLLVFVEVRVKATADYGYPEQSLSRAKINAIKRGAAAFLFQRSLPEKVRFDMISIVEYPRWELTHFEDAFF
jgi:putative endonuclease